MSADLFDRLALAYAILKAADLVDRTRGYGIMINESRMRADEGGAMGTGNPEAHKGKWMAYASRETAYADDPAEAVRLVEAQCADTAFAYLHDSRDTWAKKAHDAATALTAIQNLRAGT